MIQRQKRVFLNEGSGKLHVEGGRGIYTCGYNVA